MVEEVLDVAKGEVTGLRLRNVKTQAIDDLPSSVFMAIGHIPNTAAFDGQLERDDEVTSLRRTRASVPGVFGAMFRTATTAGGHGGGTGCIAALEAERFLVTHG